MPLSLFTLERSASALSKPSGSIRGDTSSSRKFHTKPMHNPAGCLSVGPSGTIRGDTSGSRKLHTRPMYSSVGQCWRFISAKPIFVKSNRKSSETSCPETELSENQNRLPASGQSEASLISDFSELNFANSIRQGLTYDTCEEKRRSV